MKEVVITVCVPLGDQPEGLLEFLAEQAAASISLKLTWPEGTDVSWGIQEDGVPLLREKSG